MELLLETLTLAAAVSMDAFAAGFSYGISRVRVPALSVLILSAVSALTLGISLTAGRLLTGLLPSGLARWASFGLLLLLGVYKLFDSSGTAAARGADKDHDARLSPREALPLAAALSLDSIAAGIGAGITPVHLTGILAAAFLLGAAAILGGSLLGRALSKKTGAGTAPLGGILLILLAFMKLF